jgi:hypothetical protein
MHIWTQLFVRESTMLLLLLCLGAGPAAFLSERFGAVGRLALAPVLGFSVATCVTVTVLQFEPAESTYWLLIPLGMASLALATWRFAPGWKKWEWSLRGLVRDSLQLVLVTLAVVGPINYALHHAHSTGPVSYYYTDVDNYVAEVDGAQHTSMADASRAWVDSGRPGRHFTDFTEKLWSYFVAIDDKLDAIPVEANADALFGLNATQTNAPDLVVLLLMGALGAFAAVRYAARAPTWAAVIAGAMFGGPLFLELWFDSFQAAIPGLGLLLPIAALGHAAVTTRRRSDAVLLAILVACLFSVYPLFAPPLLATAVVVAVVLLASRVRAGERLSTVARSSLASVAWLLALTIVFNPVALIRNIGYVRKLADNSIPIPRVPWHLGIGVIPGWVFQTREFWFMPSLGQGGIKQWVLGLVLPLVLAAVALHAAWRCRPARALVVFGAACCAYAEYAFLSQNSCTYCAERDLLPLAPVLAALVALGVWAVLLTRPHWVRWTGLAALAVALVAVGQRTRVELTRFIDGSYIMDSTNRGLLGHLPAKPGRLLLEGYGESESGQAELPLVYMLADEVDPGDVTIPIGANDFNSLSYFTEGSVAPEDLHDPQLRPDYRFVLTRLGAIRTSRRVIASSRGIALEQRVRSLDITPFSGLAVPLAPFNPSGAAWVQPQLPLRLYITGHTTGAVWARLTFRSLVPVSIPPQRLVTARQAGDVLTACVRATGKPPVRQVALRLTAATLPGRVPGVKFPPTIPPEGLWLTAMGALAGGCHP